MRNWLITGVSSGLGRALAQAVVEDGGVVAGTVRTAEALRAFASLCEGLHEGRTSGYLLDVTDHAAVGAVIREADAALGGIDVLVNNAGYSFEGTLEETGWDELYGQFAANVFGPVAVMKAALPMMRARGRGLIMNVSSMAAHATGGGIGAYGGAKAALEGISRALALEVEPFGIHVMTVIPGAFRTELGRNRRSAAPSIAAYQPQNLTRRERLAALSGQQRGDPRKAAAAIIEAAGKAVGAKPRPRRLVLGADAVAGISNELRTFEAEIRRWETLSVGLDLLGAG